MFLGFSTCVKSASKQQILTGVCLYMTEPAYRDAGPVGYSYPFDSVVYDYYCEHGQSLDYPIGPHIMAH